MKKIVFFLLSASLFSLTAIEQLSESKIISLEGLADSPIYQAFTAQEIYTQLYVNKILNSPATAIIKFYMPKCGECLSVKIPFEKIAQEMNTITCYEANCDSFRLEAIADALEIERVPAFIILNRGKEIGRFFGTYSYTDLKKEIQAIVSSDKSIENSDSR